jgi:hypothetical protein
MAAIFAFRCSCCGELHEGSPSIGFDAPLHYAELDADERAAQAQLGDDLCTIDHTDRRDHFVRVCLELPIHGHADPFVWGVWVSLSAENFARYRETWDAPDTADRYFGWFCNRLPGYPGCVPGSSSSRANIPWRSTSTRVSACRVRRPLPSWCCTRAGMTIRRQVKRASSMLGPGTLGSFLPRG